MNTPSPFWKRNTQGRDLRLLHGSALVVAAAPLYYAVLDQAFGPTSGTPWFLVLTVLALYLAGGHAAFVPGLDNSLLFAGLIDMACTLGFWLMGLGVIRLLRKRPAQWQTIVLTGLLLAYLFLLFAPILGSLPAL